MVMVIMVFQSLVLSCNSRLNFPKEDYQWEKRPQHSQFDVLARMSEIADLPVASC